MKFKILIIKKKNLFLSLLFILISIILISIIFFTQQNNSTETFNLIYKDKILKEDLNGDKNKDTLYINNKNNKYYMETSINNELHHISCNKKLNTLGSVDPYWPIRLQLKDISRDRIPEIFIQSSDNLLPIQHVFTYEKNEFKDIFCSNGNLLGFLDSQNNKTPKFLSGNIQNSSLDIGYYFLDNNILRNYSFDKSILPGGKSIIDFISYMESLPYDKDYKPTIFYNNISGNSLDVIENVSFESSNVKFLDGYFIDTAWDEMSNIIELECFFNFKGALKNSANFKLYSLKIILKPDSNFNNEFKIYSISF